MSKSYVGGWASITSSFKHLIKERAVFKGMKVLLRMNKDEGVDCPGCAWPDPEKPSMFEFCENGVKAIAAESTSKLIHAAFFEKHTISELKTKSDYWLEQQGRLSQPMLKRLDADNYEPITWEKAFERIGNTLSTLEHPNRAAFYTSGRTSNEAAFLYQLLGRELGTNNFPDCSNLCHESSGVALKESIGIGKGTVQLEDFEKADLIIIMGHNPATNHPRMLSDLQKAAQRGAQIIAINPLREKGLESFVHPQHLSAVLTGKASPISSLYLQPKIGGDLALLTGVIKHVLDHENVLYSSFIETETVGFEQLKKHIHQTSWDDIIIESGLKKEEIIKVADLYIKAENTIICWGMGITQHKHGVATIQQMVNLLLLKGNIGKEGSGVCPVRGHSNVQGDRTMGIHEAPPQAFLDALQQEFKFTPPQEHGYNAVETIQAMYDNEVDFFMSMGGNFIAASPDTNYTTKAISNCKLTVQVSTKLNRSHLHTGQAALILPCLGRTEADLNKNNVQKITVEDSMSKVHQSFGLNDPASKELKSEPTIVARIAQHTFTNSTIDWQGFEKDYDTIRESIANVVSGFERYNAKVKQKNGFNLYNSASKRDWKTTSGKAEFHSITLPSTEIQENHFRLMTIRSHDQYNTTIYGLNDRYRDVKGERDVIFVNEEDMKSNNWSRGTKLTLTTQWNDDQTRTISGLKVIPYNIKKRCVAAYFPETNPLVPLQSTADKSHTPTSKFIVVEITKDRNA